MPTQIGRSCLSPLIGKRGGVAGDFTVTRLAEDEFLMIGSGMAERFHQRFFAAVPLPEGTSFRSVTTEMAGFNVAGPKSRALLATCTDADLSTGAFPFMRSQRIKVAGVDVVALRVSFTGDLGWELHCAEADQLTLYRALIEAAPAFGAGPVGSRALGSLRIEKGYGSFTREYSPEYWPQESGLAGLIKLDKGDFLNRGAYLAVRDRPARDRLVQIAIEATIADASGGEPVFLPDGTPVGQVSSGAYGYSVGRSLALAYVKVGMASPGDRVHVAILGQMHEAEILTRPPFDPEGKRLRA